MEAPEIAQLARSFSVMVRIQGPDPKGLKMRRHAFHLHQSGNTTLSASGLLLLAGSLSDPPPILEQIAGICNHSGALVITAASVVEPFLTAQHRNNPTQEFSPKLIPNAHIDVLVEGKEGGGSNGEPDIASRWLPSRLLALVDVSASFDALMSLVGVHNGSHEQALWEIGWSLAPLGNGPRSGMDAIQGKVGNDLRSPLQAHGNLPSDESKNLTLMAKLATRIAFLGVSTINTKDLLRIAQPQKRGDRLLVMGSPFGVLSPSHFYNSISVGPVSNCCAPDFKYNSSLLMADIRCFPGMEGSPVFDKNACLAGILTRPLRQKGGTAEIQLVITWDAIAAACSSELRKEAQRIPEETINGSINCVPQASLCSLNNNRRSVKHLCKGPDFPCVSQSSLEKAISSIALVTVGDGAWASGIVVNSHGLILTNAHVLEPWRFGRTSLLGMMETSMTLSFEHDKPFSQHDELVGDEARGILFPSRSGSSNQFVANRHETPLLNLNYRSYKRIMVRLDQMDHRTWYGASVVYISKGAFDVALLQLESVPDQLCAITPEFACPSKGLTVHVIGHGLLGPRSDSSPSVSSGVISSVVRMPRSLNRHESHILGTCERKMPVMLQTTAAVHPGASGGAVVNSTGHMIGLITSNARHGGGTIIPHMNFSIPCAALEPIFRFLDEKDLSILQVLDKPNEQLSSLWALGPLPFTEPQAPVDKNNWEGKGSRFSQFLAEKHGEFTPLKNQEHLIKGKFPSKI